MSRNVYDEFPIGWTFVDGVITAPCGCTATAPFQFTPDEPGTFPGWGKLLTSGFSDCGKSGDICAFQAKGRVHAFRTDIPSDQQLYEWVVGEGYVS